MFNNINKDTHVLSFSLTADSPLTPGLHNSLRPLASVCDGCVTLPRGAMGLSAVCDRGIS